MQMERRNNYEIQAAQARRLFCTYDMEAIIRAHALQADAAYLYLRLLDEQYRVCRADGHIFREKKDGWIPADSFDEALTIFDLLSTIRPDQCAAGVWKTTQEFGGQVHRELVENGPASALERLFDAQPERLEHACLALGGAAMPGADLSYALPFFDRIRMAVQFWHGDEEFAPRLRFLWDANADRYLRYETMYYAMGLVRERLQEYA